MSVPRVTALVDAPPRAVSAALTEGSLLGGDGWLAPGTTVRVLGRPLRVAEVGLDGLRLVPVGRGFGLSLNLAPAAAGAVVSGTVSGHPVALTAFRRPLFGLLRSTLDRLATRAAELTAARVVVGAAIVRDRTLLAQQRSYPASAAGRWELPGGRVEPGESDVDAVARECAEELGVTVRVGAPVGPDVALPKGNVLRIHRAELTDPAAVPYPYDHQAVRWLTAGRLGSVEWLPADRVLLPALRALLTGSG